MKIYFTVDDLRDIRNLAQKYLKEREFKYPYLAVRSAKKAVKRMKRYFNK